MRLERRSCCCKKKKRITLNRNEPTSVCCRWCNFLKILNQREDTYFLPEAVSRHNLEKKMVRDVGGFRPVKSNGTNQAQKALPEKVDVEEIEPDDQKQDEAGAQSSTGDEPEEKITGSQTDDSGADDHNSHSPTTTKKSQSSSSKARHLHDEEISGEEDNCYTSSHPSARTNKFKVTVPVGPKFVCEDRLERRKEYYSKLEEKHKAMEREKQEAEARQKEEEAAAIKQLRKTMVYKANPIPSFYREGPPPKVELKKLPLTRPKSPRLTRRRSCGDEGRPCSKDKGLHERERHQSPGPRRAKGKERIGERRSAEVSKSKDDPQEQVDHTDDEE